MTDRLDAVIQQLHEEEAELASQRKQLEQQLKQLNEESKRVQTALAALGCKPPAKGGGRRSLSRLCPTRQQIAEVVAEVLQLNEALQTDVLRTKVESCLKSRGLSRARFSTTFDEALSDERFVESPAGWKLVEEQHVAHAEAAHMSD